MTTRQACAVYRDHLVILGAGGLTLAGVDPFIAFVLMIVATTSEQPPHRRRRRSLDSER